MIEIEHFNVIISSRIHIIYFTKMYSFRCVSLCEPTETDLNSRDSCAWQWIAANDSQQLGKRNAADAAWKLLQKYLEQEEKPPQTILHRAITQQLVRLNCNYDFFFILFI